MQVVWQVYWRDQGGYIDVASIDDFVGKFLDIWGRGEGRWFQVLFYR